MVQRTQEPLCCVKKKRIAQIRECWIRASQAPLPPGFKVIFLRVPFAAGDYQQETPSCLDGGPTGPNFPGSYVEENARMRET